MTSASADSFDYEVAIVGGGPIGLEMAASLERAGVEYVQFEAGQIGETIFKWPPHTQFFSSPERVAIAGIPVHNVDQSKLTREAYLAYLRAVVDQLDLKVNSYEKVLEVERDGDGFSLATQTQLGERSYRCRRVVLATGGGAGANLIGVPGEDLPHVTHYPADPHRYFRRRVLVVGGRNSALETALRCWRAGAEVTLSYRRAEMHNVSKRHLSAEVGGLIRVGEITFYAETAPVEITPRHVVLARVKNGQTATGERIECEADFVLLCTGFVADMSLFNSVGVELYGERRVPNYSEETMETNVPGLYVAGTAIAGTQKRYEVFIENCHAHVVRIVTAITGKPPEGVRDDHWLRADRES